MVWTKCDYSQCVPVDERFSCWVWFILEYMILALQRKFQVSLASQGPPIDVMQTRQSLIVQILCSCRSEAGSALRKNHVPSQ